MIAPVQLKRTMSSNMMIAKAGQLKRGLPPTLMGNVKTLGTIVITAPVKRPAIPPA
jgi:hypothetical protein